ncbi:hypothetical protein SAMN05216553_10833 [Lentzea fradiae]|uniref:Uncharacterized protein n=1 Tax=Lentzea fradiae TaxID=200378 RepID=A0A1G7U7N0_9PSEU|nr:hypothetical protein [Lentzea fradiae]SDG43069.1 hypothetical protein SAMN05216553_10833 [Lentzea fradiae]
MGTQQSPRDPAPVPHDDRTPRPVPGTTFATEVDGIVIGAESSTSDRSAPPATNAVDAHSAADVLPQGQDTPDAGTAPKTVTDAAGPDHAHPAADDLVGDLYIGTIGDLDAPENGFGTRDDGEAGL